MVKHYALTKINSVTVETETDPGLGCVTSVIPEHATGGWKSQCPLFLSVCLKKGTLTRGRFNPIPRIRSGLEPTVRIDICESTVHNHFAIKAFCTSRNN
jgi:hypothetical protein